MSENVYLHLVFYYGGVIGSGLAVILTLSVIVVYLMNKKLGKTGVFVLTLACLIFAGSCVMWWRGAVSEQREEMDRVAEDIVELVKVERIMRENINTLKNMDLSDTELLRQQIQSVDAYSYRMYLIIGSMEENFGLEETYE